jgi:hypothetical protein
MTTLKCKYCGVSLLVRGEKGVLKYHQLRKAEAGNAEESARKWFGGIDKARDLRKRAIFETPFLVYLPFWRITGKVVGWIFGNQVKKEVVRRGDRTHVRTRRVPVERMVMKDYVWTNAACDVSEFGVESVDMPSPDFSMYDRQKLQEDGMIFEPTEAKSDAIDEAKRDMRSWAKGSVKVDEVTFEKLNVVDVRPSIVYYPLWVLRYDYKGRRYQMVTDGATSGVLYGRAPGSTLFRVASLVGTMLVGNLILTTVIRIQDLDYRAMIVVVLLCLGLMAAGFWKFRYGGEVKKGGRGKSAVDAAKLQELWKYAPI